MKPKYVGHRTMPGWSGALPFYQFTCKIHGLVENYPSGYDEILLCPKCIEEAITKAGIENRTITSEPPIKEMKV